MNRQYSDEDPELSQYIKVIIKYRKTVFLTVVASLFVALCLVLFLPKVFEATAIVKIGYVSEYPVNKKEAIANIEYNKKISAVLNSLKINPDVLSIKIKAEEVNGQPDFLKITVIGSDPHKAFAIANAASNIFVDEGRDIYNAKIELLKEEIKELEKEKIKVDEYRREFLGRPVNSKVVKNMPDNYMDVCLPLIGRISSLKERILSSNDYEVIKPATLPVFPIKPNKKLIIVIALNIGLISGTFMAFMMDYYLKHKKRRSIKL